MNSKTYVCNNIKIPQAEERCISKKVLKATSVLTCFPLIHSVARELDAIADPHPKVLNFASTIFPLSSTFIFKTDKKEF